MILTVTLNAAVDKTYTVENFRIDRVHRPASWRIVPGGKGINVARVYNELGGKVLATGFAGGHNGDYILDGMRSEGLVYDFVRTEEESRVCIAVIDPAQNTQTELNEVGPNIRPDEVERLKLKFESLVPGVEYAVLSGSAPPGVPDEIYFDLIEVAHHYGVRCLLDTSGDPLKVGLEAKPFMAKPNVHELSAVMGKQLATIAEVSEATCELSQRGIEIVAVTLGRDGALIASRDELLRAKPPEIPFVSAVGSGDAFAAAFVFALEQGQSMRDAFQLGTGAGAANAMTFGAGFCRRESIYGLAEQTEITPLKLGVR